MHVFRSSTLLCQLLFHRLGLAVPIIVHPGTIANLQITADDTLNSSIVDTSASSGLLESTGATSAASGGELLIRITNSLNSNNVTGYVSGLDANNQLIMLDTSGSYFYPTSNSTSPTPIGSNVAIPLGAVNHTLDLTLPGYIGSARLWVAEGTLEFFVISTPDGPGLVEPSVVNPDDPNAAVNFDLIEFNWGARAGLYADVSYVNFVGIPLAVTILDHDGTNTSSPGIPANGAELLCDGLRAQATLDGRPWDQLCAYTEAGRLIRVLSPSAYLSVHPTAFAGYFSKYVRYVWERYARAPLTVDTQTSAGPVNCTVAGNDTLTCAGDNRGYPRPAALDIFSCDAGAFATEPADNAVHRAVTQRLCAAFNRATLYLPAGHVQPAVPPADYYSVHPANWYAALLHRIQVDGRGYAFPYDDISPSPAEDVSGLIVSTDPAAMLVTVGGV